MLCSYHETSLHTSLSCFLITILKSNHKVIDKVHISQPHPRPNAANMPSHRPKLRSQIKHLLRTLVSLRTRYVSRTLDVNQHSIKMKCLLISKPKYIHTTLHERNTSTPRTSSLITRATRNIRMATRAHLPNDTAQIDMAWHLRINKHTLLHYSQSRLLYAVFMHENSCKNCGINFDLNQITRKTGVAMICIRPEVMVADPLPPIIDFDLKLTFH